MADRHHQNGKWVGERPHPFAEWAAGRNLKTNHHQKKKKQSVTAETSAAELAFAILRQSGPGPVQPAQMPAKTSTQKGQNTVADQKPNVQSSQAATVESSHGQAIPAKPTPAQKENAEQNMRHGVQSNGSFQVEISVRSHPSRENTGSVPGNESKRTSDSDSNDYESTDEYKRHDRQKERNDGNKHSCRHKCHCDRLPDHPKPNQMQAVPSNGTATIVGYQQINPQYVQTMPMASFQPHAAQHDRLYFDYHPLGAYRVPFYYPVGNMGVFPSTQHGGARSDIRSSSYTNGWDSHSRPIQSPEPSVRPREPFPRSAQVPFNDGPPRRCRCPSPSDTVPLRSAMRGGRDSMVSQAAQRNIDLSPDMPAISTMEATTIDGRSMTDPTYLPFPPRFHFPDSFWKSETKDTQNISHRHLPFEPGFTSTPEFWRAEQSDLNEASGRDMNFRPATADHRSPKKGYELMVPAVRKPEFCIPGAWIEGSETSSMQSDCTNQHASHDCPNTWADMSVTYSYAPLPDVPDPLMGRRASSHISW
ncbi:uncharacterized protein SPSK_04123 [Sporothrix schenckii 1099-18]|uniref:Uncharacterized protein n=1 Tax=Sporothrix schenckii 1099-18 TaxID=1397361 RepID=A0A0F2M4Z8_SPOSC|nr:uncharacterized protein SPSK_04123 [Sporothrix schenckii 1099-18]KJR83261.1 hypothetical protein SPSK_04123 [Sporothrix schenckii 1099-18]